MFRRKCILVPLLLFSIISDLYLCAPVNQGEVSKVQSLGKSAIIAPASLKRQDDGDGDGEEGGEDEPMTDEDGDGEGGGGGGGGDEEGGGGGGGDGQSMPPGLTQGLTNELPAAIFDDTPISFPVGRPVFGSGGGGRPSDSESMGNSNSGNQAEEPAEAPAAEMPEPSRPNRPKGPIGRAVNEVRRFRERTNGFVNDVRKRLVDWLDGYSGSQAGQNDDSEEGGEGEADADSEESRRRAFENFRH
ncbi:uncharacterized protein LOC141855915 [Brevipalpus obovatus]|uniref:uncharacterized protein LOC141855915 n=1 Tax=Brevipalpus obovatus TaxID=246614 RepID=UPI003D9E4075